MLLWLTLHTIHSRAEHAFADGIYELVEPATDLKADLSIQLPIFSSTADQDLHQITDQPADSQGKHHA